MPYCTANLTNTGLAADFIISLLRGISNYLLRVCFDLVSILAQFFVAKSAQTYSYYLATLPIRVTQSFDWCIGSCKNKYLQCLTIVCSIIPFVVVRYCGRPINVAQTLLRLGCNATTQLFSPTIRCIKTAVLFATNAALFFASTVQGALRVILLVQESVLLMMQSVKWMQSTVLLALQTVRWIQSTVRLLQPTEWFLAATVRCATPTEWLTIETVLFLASTERWVTQTVLSIASTVPLSTATLRWTMPTVWPALSTVLQT